MVEPSARGSPASSSSAELSQQARVAFRLWNRDRDHRRRRSERRSRLSRRLRRRKRTRRGRAKRSRKCRNRHRHTRRRRRRHRRHLRHRRPPSAQRSLPSRRLRWRSPRWRQRRNRFPPRTPSTNPINGRRRTPLMPRPNTRHPNPNLRTLIRSKLPMPNNRRRSSRRIRPLAINRRLIRTRRIRRPNTPRYRS